MKFHLFAHLSHTLTTSKCILYAPGWATVSWSTAKISSLTDCFAIYNIRFSSNLPLSISEELFCHVFSLFSVESLSLKPFINHFPLLSWNALSYLKYARLVCVCARVYALGGELSSKCTPREILRETHTDAGIAYFKYSRSLSSKEKEKSEVTPKKSHKDGNQTDFACLKVLTLIWPSQTSSILLTKNEKYMFPWFDFSQKTFILLIGSFCVWGSIRKVNTGMRSWRRFCPTKWQESNVLAYREGQPLIHFPASCWKTDCIRFVFSAKHPPLVASQPKLAKSVGVLGGHFGQHPATNAVLRSSPNKSVQGGNKPDSGSVRINNTDLRWRPMLEGGHKHIFSRVYIAAEVYVWSGLMAPYWDSLFELYLQQLKTLSEQ